MLLVLLVLGCASPGPPRPPTLNLAPPAKDLSATRVGDRVLLHWTTPVRTTDGLLVRGNLTAHICRSILGPIPPTGSVSTHTSNQQPPANTPSANVPCTEILRLPTQPGSASASDTLPRPLTSGPVELLEYRVDLVNISNGSAGPSNPAFVPSGPAPRPVEELRVRATPTGVVLEWSDPLAVPSTPSDSVELDRINPALLAARPNLVKPKPSQLPRAFGSQQGDQEPAEVHLRVSASADHAPGISEGIHVRVPAAPTTNSPLTGDPEAHSGTVDRTAHFGETYTYIAQRILKISLSGHLLEIRSAPSAAVSLTLRDTFPPSSPQGLAAVPSRPDTTPGAAIQPSIDLSWEPNFEPDLAGYFVYRRSLAEPAAPALRLTPLLLLVPAFHDVTVTSAHTYGYTVTAVDVSGNESSTSPEISQTVP